MSNDAERWKNKYFAKIEEFEKTEKRFDEHIHLLERVLVRVSLAAEGVDPALDKELGSLRTLLRREDHSVSELGQQLDRIEARVLALDEHKAGLSEQMLEALQSLCEVLAEAVESRDLRKQLKQFGKALRDRVDEVREYPALLKEYQAILGRSLQEVLAAAGGAPAAKGGFFSRLFGGRGATEGSAEAALTAGRASNEITVTEPGATESGAMEGEEPTPASILDAAESEAEDEDRYDLDAESPSRQDAGSEDRAVAVSEEGGEATPTTPSGESASPGSMADTSASPQFSSIADRLQAILGNLLEQLALPANLDKTRDQLKQRLQGRLNWYELIPTLDDLALLVISAVGRGQQEFEQFLKSLDERLAQLQAFLTHAESSHSQSRENNAELEQRMRAHVSTLQDDVRTAGSLETLKASVETNLDSLIHAIDDFMRKETARESSLSQEMAQLKERLQSLEAESASVKERLAEEQRRAQTDVLTGLPNRLAWDARIQEEFARWRRYGRPLTLVVADIDFFKRINDNYGHLAGDRVLQLIGKEVARRIRTTDFLARFGGEEFVVLLPETEASVAAQVMEKTREMVSRMPFHFRNQKVQITMSFGVCEFQGQDSIDAVFERADQALYRAKAGGRNQVQLATP